MLTVSEVNSKTPTDKVQCFTDSLGMYLEVRPTGAKYWRLKYRFNGKENRLSLGVYPKVSLKEARAARDAARKLLADGTDPSHDRKSNRDKAKVSAANTFEAIALEWHGIKKGGWSTEHAKVTLAHLSNNVFPWLGVRAIDSIEAPDLLATLRRIEARGRIDTAHRVRALTSDVFMYAIATGRAIRNPAADVGAGLKTVIKGHHAAITDPKRFADLLRSVDAYSGAITRASLQLSALTFQRPNEVCNADWQEIDLDAATWTIPPARMKGTLAKKAHGTPHVVPLSWQAVAVLRDLHPLTGHGAKVFPNERGEGKSISGNTGRQALTALGYLDHSVHGFRATARTLIREALHYENEVIERQLAHGSKEVLGGAYDRTQFVTERTRMMQDWADYLDRLRVGAEVIQLRKA